MHSTISLDTSTQERMFSEIKKTLGLPDEARLFVLPMSHVNNPSFLERMQRAHMSELTAAAVQRSLGSSFGNVSAAKGIPVGDVTRYFCVFMFVQRDQNTVGEFFPGASQLTTKVNFPLPGAYDAWAGSRNSRAAEPDVQIVAGAFPAQASVALSPNGTTAAEVKGQYLTLNWQQPNPQGGSATRSISVAVTADVADPTDKTGLGPLTVVATSFQVYDGCYYQMIVIPAVADASGQLAPQLWRMSTALPPAITFTGTATTRVTAVSSYKKDGLRLETSDGTLID